MVTPEFGGPGTFEERDVQKPEPGPGEVLVRVFASGTNPIEPGDEVYYSPEIFGPGSNGGYAEYHHLADADIVAHKPASLSHEEAATLPLAGGMAYEAIVRRLGVQVGDTVLIHGGAGGVGSFAIQIARAAGARVLASAGPDNQQTLSNLGADVAIDYTQQDVSEAALEDTGGYGVDTVLDTVGGDTIVNSIPATRPFGNLATILGATGDLTPLYINNQTPHGILLIRERQRLDEMSLLVERGQIKPLVEEVLDLSEVGQAHERLDSGHGRGKIVLKVSG